MLIKRVELRNIKNHAERDFSFQPGVTAICGPNGSGKTTILEAIAWALFDHLGYKREEFVRRGEKKGQVTVSFVSDLDDREYQVTRDTGGGYFVHDPVTKMRLVEQRSQVVPWLRQRLGVDAAVDLPTLFRTTIGVPQGTFTWDFAQSPANRKAVFDQILKVEEYRQAADNLRVTQRLAESRVADADRQVASFEGELKAFDEVEAARADCAGRLRVAEAAEARLLAERERLGAECELWEERRQRLERQRAEVEQLRSRVGGLREALAVAEAAVGEARESALVVEKARDGWLAFIAAQRQLSALESQRQDRDRLRGELGQREREMVEVAGRRRRSEDELREIGRARVEAELLDGEVVRQEDLESAMARLREGRGELQGLRQSLASLEGELKSLRSRYSEFARQIAEAEARSGEAGRIEDLQREWREIEAEEQREQLERERWLARAAERERVELNLARLDEEEARCQAEVADLERLSPLASGLEGIEAEQSALNGGLSRLRAELARDEEMVTALEGGGLCPLLTERCLNLRPGESIDERFRAGRERRMVEIVAMERSHEAISARLTLARQAALRVASLPALRSTLTRLAEERAALGERLAGLSQPELSVEELADNAERRRRRIRALEEEIAAARQAQRLLHRAEVLRDDQGRLQAEGEMRRAEYDRLQERLRQLGGVEEEIAQAASDLQSLGDPRSRLLALRRTIGREAEWREANAVAAEAEGALGAEIDRLNGELAPFEGLDLAITSATRQRSLSESDHQAFIANERLAMTLAAREREAQMIAGESERLAMQLGNGEAHLLVLEAGYDADGHRQLRAGFDRCREEAARLETDLVHLRAESARLDARLDALREARERMRTVTAERETFTRQREATEMVRELLVRAAPYITESYIFSISHEANQLYREISGRYDLSLRWNREYEITIEEDGHERPFTSLSGGEQMVAALAVRLALLRELSQIDIAFFDEPTTNMDEERRANLARQLGRISNFRQLFVISHDDTFEGFTDQTINLGEHAA